MSEVKVNKISPRTNCGTVQLGDSGDTITIPAGASITNSGTASGFGATGAVSWNTTVKTSGFTAVAGEGYFVNTTGGAVSVNLPAGTAGAVVGFKDYANTFDSNAVTLVQNGSDKIGGSTVNATLSTEGLAVTLVFIDSTQGWLVTDNGTQDTAPTAQYVTATGGTITTSGDFKIHTFTGPGTFCVSCAGNAAGSTLVDYLIVGGGGAGGSGDGGGGGAGGYRESPGAASGCYSVSPLGTSPAAALPVPATAYPITVGAGGAGRSTPAPNTGGNQGNTSTFSTITSAGGGGGAGGGACSSPYTPGGSGGGARRDGNGQGGGTGNVPIVSPPQGKDGGTPNAFPGPSGWNGAGGGGGATANGTGGTGNTPASERAGNGGAGATSSINGTPTARAGGGGGGAEGNSPNCFGTGGTGGGGVGFNPGRSNAAGTANTGGGGGGRANPGTGSAGGSGIVIIRYKFQN
jgi:hypothetical protein